MSPFYYSSVEDVNDRQAWSETDILDLRRAAAAGDTLEDAAGLLCRAGTVDEVRRKARDLGLHFRSSGDR